MKLTTCQIKQEKQKYDEYYLALPLFWWRHGFSSYFDLMSPNGISIDDNQVQIGGPFKIIISNSHGTHLNSGVDSQMTVCTYCYSIIIYSTPLPTPKLYTLNEAALIIHMHLSPRITQN
jgi:hypothetical protein